MIAAKTFGLLLALAVLAAMMLLFSSFRPTLEYAFNVSFQSEAGC